MLEGRQAARRGGSGIVPMRRDGFRKKCRRMNKYERRRFLNSLAVAASIKNRDSITTRQSLAISGTEGSAESLP